MWYWVTTDSTTIFPTHIVHGKILLFRINKISSLNKQDTNGNYGQNNTIPQRKNITGEVGPKIPF